VASRTIRSDPRQQAWRLILEMHALVVPRLADELRAELDLPLTWYDALLHLYEAPGARARMSDLARAVLISRSGLTTIVDHLEDAGLVRREVPREDRRSVEVVMTDEGRRRFEEARPFHRAGIDRWFCSQLTKREGAELAELLTRVNAAAADPPG